MKTFYERLEEEETLLRKQVDYLKKRISSYPSGLLRVSYSNGCVQYYIKDTPDVRKFWNTAAADKVSEANNDSEGIDLSADLCYRYRQDRELAASIAQRDYDIRLLKELEMRLKTIGKARKIYCSTAPEKTAEQFSSGRRMLIQPLLMTDEEYAEQWQMKEYYRKPFSEDSPEIFTVKGERVRSKSEKIIADTLERNGVPYHYEYPFEIVGKGIFHPDFYVLNVRTRQEFFWEHLGKMDDMQYAADALSRIEAYEKEGLLPGDSLIITHETKTAPLNLRVVDLIISRFML